MDRDQAYFRRDIQGLRGISVLVVVLYHAGLQLPGGFVGVDMFFVISGFVVSRLIFDEVQSTGAFSFSNFFSRRIRRLIPILTLVNVLTLLGVHIFLSPFGERQQASATASASAFFSANVNLMRDNSYINLIDNPFRHLWSLAVEEQFYLFFPVLAVLCLLYSRRSKRSFVALSISALSILAVCSFLLALYSTRLAVGESWNQFGFFGLPTRIWEFVIGILAMVFLGHWRIEANPRIALAGGCGVIGIVWALICLKESNEFPQVTALIPVVSTALLLVCSVHGSLLRKILSAPFLVRIGDASYGWYLWHWPMIVFTQRVWPDQFVATCVASIFALVLSFVSLRLIENPIRSREVFAGRRALALLILCSLTVLATARLVNFNADRTTSLVLAGSKDKAAANRWGQGLALRDTFLSSEERCHSAEVPFIVDTICSNEITIAQPTIFLIGDSHADSASNGVLEAGKRLGVKTFGWHMPGCPLLSGYSVNHSDICNSATAFSTNAVNYYKPDVVVIADSYVTYLTGEQPADEVDRELRNGKISSFWSDNVRTIVLALAQFVAEVGTTSQHVVVMLEVPFAIMPGTTGIGECPAHELLRRAINNEITHQFENNSDVTVFDPEPFLLEGKKPCESASNESNLYWHKTHLNKSGSLKLVEGWKGVFSLLLK